MKVESVYGVEEEVKKDITKRSQHESQVPDLDAAGSSELDFGEMNRLWRRGLILDDLIVRHRGVLERVPFGRIAVLD